MNVKINDNVLVIAGKDKGKQGKVIATSPKAHTVKVEGVRMQKKHEKARKANENSKIVEVPGPIDVSNVMASPLRALLPSVYVSVAQRDPIIEVDPDVIAEELKPRHLRQADEFVILVLVF